jgi:hypothetical protein
VSTRSWRCELSRGLAENCSFFSVLGVLPLHGRTFSEDQDRAAASVVVISHGLWQRRYGGAPSILRQTLLMNGNRLEVMGVMPREFVFRDGEIDYWIPFRSSLTPAAAIDRRSHYLNVVARLKPGVSVETANLDMRRVSDVLKHKYPDTNSASHHGRGGKGRAPSRDRSLARIPPPAKALHANDMIDDGERWTS